MATRSTELMLLTGHQYTVDEKRIETSFTYHSPNASQLPRYQELREKAKELAYLIAEIVPDSREKSLAFTELEAAVMWANRAIAHE